MEIKVTRSKRRRRTVSARLVKDTLLVSAPLIIPDCQLDNIIAGFKDKFERRRIKDALDKSEWLKEITPRLNEKYFQNKLKINSIEYVIDQNSKFGCCNYSTGRIRISHKIGAMPEWVRIYVLVHEMAHLIEPNHSKAFWDIVNRYKFAERAKGFLMAVGLEMQEESILCDK